MGGPKREFFRLFAAAVYDSSLFQGGVRKVFSSSVQGLQVRVCTKVPMMMLLFNFSEG